MGHVFWRARNCFMRPQLMAIYCIYYLDHILYPKNPNDALQELPASKKGNKKKNCIMGNRGAWCQHKQLKTQ